MISTHIISARSMVGIVAAVPAVFALKHAWEVYGQTRVVDRSRIVSKGDISDAYRQSSTIKDIVNPRDHVSTSDSRYVDLTLPKNAREVTDERILAAFTHGFFGGKVFAPERIVLAAIGRDFTGFEGLGANSELQRVWTVSGISSFKLPTLHSLLFGAFQVCNIELQYEDKDAGDGPSTRSSIDFAYGSDQGRFAGAHRFSVIRDSNRSDVIRVVFESLSCNPTVNKPFGPEFALVFHRAYAMLLFQDSIASLVQDLNGV
ncbi:hypothetical protein GCG54_00008830 [Colletotrichum gloeosporioides]|uniref:Uncharacterized protein n=1 Tax=Colletotrichum gloeosporioides TaxID=474922 RepID=A0A8H4CNR0_COLGL|nr:uncharacterized protein GCG54_00008830 [Colletotrichum gloeosporioides]KAF3807373.1 hypothetical protein GCG54_00008830 [Colletotrichum gloeosporioides]